MQNLDTVELLEFSDIDKKEIELCLNCPAPECFNCLERPHDPGCRPKSAQFDIYQKRAACMKLLKRGISPYKVALLVGCIYWLAQKVQAELIAEGVL